MKINVSEELRKNTWIGNVFLQGVTELGSNVVTEIADNYRTGGCIVVDMKLTVNDMEIDMESFFKRCDETIDREILKKAQEIVDDNFYDLVNMSDTLREKIKDEVNKRLGDWEDPYE